ncbi:MAG: hypothetical protein R2684_06105 [Pyrinomonadaceae bacterium]
MSCTSSAPTSPKEDNAPSPAAGADGPGDIAESPSEAVEPAPDKKSPLIISVYTDLTEDKCTDVEVNEDEGWSVQSCKGFGEYKLEVSEGDLRQSIDVIAPDGRRHKLNLPTVVSAGFSTIGDKAEWVLRKSDKGQTPIALIVRYNANEDPENPDQVTSYLTVSKITNEGACVTDVVGPIKNANEKARQLAQGAAAKPCK